MPEGAHIADTTDVPDVGSYLFTAKDAFTNEREIIFVRCGDRPRIEAWVNNCTHENQRLDRGTGAAMRDNEIICPKHGSMFDACSGDCDNGEAAGTTLPSVEITVTDDGVFLTDDNYQYLHDGGIDDGAPGSTSHISL
jgi:nitrite reductase/ring-hydroxylating ferredoxin subunit